MAADEKLQHSIKEEEGDAHDRHLVAADADDQLWGKAFRWEIRGASVEEVWRITGDFVRADRWVTSLLQSCELVAGHANQAGCVRKATMYPSAPGQPATFAFEKLLLIDPPSQHLQYTILPGATLPGFSLMDGYVSTFRLITPPASPSPYPPPVADAGPPPSSTRVLLHWSFTCKPSAALTQEQAVHTAFSLYNTAVNDLKALLSLPDDGVTLLD